MAHINAGRTGPGSRRYRPRRGQEWQVSPASIAAQLKARGLLPSLQGYKVVFSDLGIDIPGPQPAPWLPEDRILVCYLAAGPMRQHRPSAISPTPTCQDHRDVVDMSDRTTHSDHCKIYSFFLSRLKSRLSAITQQVFAVPDTHARRHGWQVTVTRGGFGRRYRDPRFDYLAPCAACNGRGCNPHGTTCSACHGTGRIVLDPAAVSQPRRGRP